MAVPKTAALRLAMRAEFAERIWASPPPAHLISHRKALFGPSEVNELRVARHRDRQPLAPTLAFPFTLPTKFANVVLDNGFCSINSVGLSIIGLPMHPFGLGNVVAYSFCGAHAPSKFDNASHRPI
jgi:hypothetical protein